MGCGKKVLVTFSATKTQPCRSNNLFCWCWNGWRCAWSKINFWEVGFDFHLKVRLRLLCCLCSKNFWKNWSFALFYGISVYLYKSTIQSCIGYCCHGWAGAPKYYLDILDRLQKRFYKAVGPALSVFSWTYGSSLWYGQSKSIL